MFVQLLLLANQLQLTMKCYKVTVRIESNEGNEFVYEGKRHFINDNHVKPWVDGFESGAAAAHDGSVLSTDIECLGDYLTVKTIRRAEQSEALRED